MSFRFTSGRRGFGIASLVTLLACTGDETGTGGGGGQGGKTPYPDPSALPALTQVVLTTEARRVPTMAPKSVADAAALDPRRPDDVTTLLAQGYGDETTAPGEPVETMTLDGTPAPSNGPNAKMLVRFVHLSDVHVVDDESPTRVATLDTPQGPTDGAFRPQEAYEGHILNATVRTINKLSESMPVGFVLMGGDSSDNSQGNEVDWVMSILDGNKRVEVDSGTDDDPVAGPQNDPKDPFNAEGLKMPWLWVSGNHDELSQGNFVPQNLLANYVSNNCDGGTRDWSKAGGPVKTGEIVADAKRTPYIGVDLVKHVEADGDGHGLDQHSIDTGRSTYAYDVPNTNLRFLVLDTASPTGSADGLVLQSDVDAIIKPALDKAVIDKKLVVVTSHHSSGQLTDGGGYAGTKQANAVLPPAFRNILGSYPNVLMHLAGHTHKHHVGSVQPTSGNPYWEMETSALVDFPDQMRVIEIWDLDNGHYGIKAIAVDYSVEGDPLGAEGRKRGITDFTSGWAGDGSGMFSEAGMTSDRNVELLVPKN